MEVMKGPSNPRFSGVLRLVRTCPRASARHVFRLRKHYFDQGGNLNGMRRVPRRAAEAMERLKELERLRRSADARAVCPCLWHGLPTSSDRATGRAADLPTHDVGMGYLHSQRPDNSSRSPMH